jgi:beta-lactam-binding protein with PASTA domain
MATVTITADVNALAHDHDGTAHKTVTIGYTGDVDVRAFALDINVDNGMNIGDSNVTGFLRGESISPTIVPGKAKGYGIFPGRFRDFINPSLPDWDDLNYMPLAPWAAPGAENTGLGWPKMVVEMGTLWATGSADINKPDQTGTLFTFDINSEGGTDCNLTVAADALRGGIVSSDAVEIIAANLPLTIEVAFPCTVPDVVDQLEAAATEAITTAGYNLGTRTTARDDSIDEGKVISTTPAGGEQPACDTDVAYVVSLGPCVVPDVVDELEATATEAITTAGFNLGDKTTARDDDIDAGNVISTTPAAGVQPCGTDVNYVVSLGPCVVPNVVNQAEATATLNITNAGFALGARTTACHATIIPGNVISTTPANPATPGCGTSVAYLVSLGNTPGVPASCTVPATTDADGVYNVTWGAGPNATSYVLESSDANAGTTVYALWVPVYSGTAQTYAEKVGGGVWSYRVKSVNACSESGYTAGDKICTVPEALRKTNPVATGYADWVKYRHPACWAFRRQCHGDINGKRAISGGYVSADDLTIFKSMYFLSQAQIAAAPCTTFTTTQRICGFCADLDHKNKISGGRVSADDLGVFKTYYFQADVNVPCCDFVPPAGDCTLVAPDPNFIFWTN